MVPKGNEEEGEDAIKLRVIQFIVYFSRPLATLGKDIKRNKDIALLVQTFGTICGLKPNGLTSYV